MKTKLYRPLTEAEKDQLNDIIDIVCLYYVLDRKELLGKTRMSRYVFGRATYYNWAKETTIIPGTGICMHINKDHASGHYYRRLYYTDYSFKNAFDEFSLKHEHMKTTKDLINLKFKNYPELRAKFLFIETLIDDRFTTVQYRNLHFSKLKHQISNFKTSDFDRSMSDLYDFVSTFVDEYYSGDMNLKFDFETIGLENGKDC